MNDHDTMTQQIRTMLEMQDDMNTRVNPGWRDAGQEWYRAIWIEASEMLEHYGWKWWKKQQPDVMQVKLEIVDIVHFALSIRIEQGAPGGMDEIAAAIRQEFAAPEGSDELRTSIELLAKNTLIDQGAHFANIAGIMQHLDMSFAELYRVYVGKNVLNFFRQDHGYKDGSYIKEWHGREDNEVLAEILERLDSASPGFKDDVYAALLQAYPESAVA